MVQPLFLVAIPDRKADVELMIADEGMHNMLKELGLPQLEYRSPYQLNTEAVSRSIGDGKNDSIAGFTQVPTPFIVLAKHFFDAPRDVRRFIFAHELRHAWQGLVDHSWQQYFQWRSFIVRRFPPVTQDTFHFFSAPAELDAQEYAFRYSPPVIASSIVCTRADQLLATIFAHRDYQIDSTAAIIDLLPRLYEWSHLASAKKFVKADEKRIENVRLDILQFLFSRTPLGSDMGSRQLFEKYMAAGPSTFLTEAAKLLQKLW